MGQYITIAEEKERKLRDSEKKERRRREKNNGFTLCFYTEVFGKSCWKKKIAWLKRSILAVTFSKIQLSVRNVTLGFSFSVCAPSLSFYVVLYESTHSDRQSLFRSGFTCTVCNSEKTLGFKCWNCSFCVAGTYGDADGNCLLCPAGNSFCLFWR